MEVDSLFSFLKQLAAHFKEERSVQFYASALFITPKHLTTKTAKGLTSKTCGEFIDEMVIAEAKILPGDLSYSIWPGSRHLHFSAQFYFPSFSKEEPV
jgi:AraC family transcriptional activator of pobA